MAPGALIGAYLENDAGQLRALLPLAGRTLLEYQVRCAAAAGATPIVVVVERVPQALRDALERLRLDSISVFAVSDVQEAVSRFEAGSMILLIGDGVAPPAELVEQFAEEPEPAVAIVPDDDDHADYERIDAESRWAGVAVVDSQLLGSTAAILGDWDLQSTLLRRTLQEGTRLLAAEDYGGEPLVVEDAEQLDEFQRSLIAGSRAARTDWASRYVLPPIEEFAVQQLMERGVRPAWLVSAALVLTLVGAFCFVRGWLVAGFALLILSTPLDIVGARLASLRLRPLSARMLSRRALWPAAGLALLTLGWWEMRHGGGWGALLAAICAAAFAEAGRIELRLMAPNGELWLFSRRNAILVAIPFALFGAWTGYLVGMLIYAALSFFIIQHVRHRPAS
jgi:hypothetical protein